MSMEELLLQMGITDPESFGGEDLSDAVDASIQSQDAQDENSVIEPVFANCVKCDEFTQYSGSLLAENKEIGCDKLGLDKEAFQDIYAVAYQDDLEINKRVTNEVRKDFLVNLIENPEIESLRNDTVHNPDAAEIAALHLATRLKKWLVENEPSKAPPPTKGGESSKKRDLKNQLDCMVAAQQAVAAAKKAVDEHNEVVGIIGGTGGEGFKKIDAKQDASLVQRIKKSKRLRTIAEQAGRYQRVAKSKQRNKVVHGSEETVGVTLSGNIFDLVPSELVNLSHRLLRMNTIARIVDRKAMTWDKVGIEKVAKGPVAIIVDESGSMEDGVAGGRNLSHRHAKSTPGFVSKVEYAKALALALANVAREQKRWVALVGFSGGTEGNVLMLPPTGWDQVALLDWLEHFYGNGTDMDVPMRELPEKYWKEFMAAGAIRGKTDLIMITDGQVNMPESVEKSFMAWKKEETVKLQTLVINSSPGDLERVSDTCHIIDGAALENIGEPIEEVMAI